MICDICNNVIYDEYWKVTDIGNVCDNCIDSVQICTKCDSFVKKGYSYKGKVICEACFKGANICRCCGKPILGQTYLNKRYPYRYFCKDCSDKANRCDFCGSPVGETVFEYSDKRISCQLCNSTAIITIEQLVEIEKDTLVWMKQKMDMDFQGIDYNMQLVDSNEIKKIFGIQDYEDKKRFTGIFRHFNNSNYIYIENGFPKNNVYNTLAHEMTHLWQFYNFPKQTSQLWIEGHAVWISYQICIDKNFQYDAKIEYDRIDKLYGLGFRKIRALENIHGSKELNKNLIIYLKNNI